jgi:predicted dehydrogenase
MVRVAIVGCGKIADQHVHAVHRISESSIIAVCDREPLMAKQLAERFGIIDYFDDVSQMLSKTSPDVVHITTPPQSHHELARQCLQAGTHVYIEKPFTVTASETESLIDLAQRSNLYITVGHNYQFTSEMLEMRRLVDGGFLGGNPVHLESYWTYDLGDTSYVGPLLGDSNHWVRQLPGQLLHNLISHGIARLAEFLDDDITSLICCAHQSAQLRDLGGEEVVDELRVVIRVRNDMTGFFCFSTQIKPRLNQWRIFGGSNSITVDLLSGTVIKHPGKSYKSYLTYLVPPVKSARQYFASSWRNAVNILRWRLYQDAGMKELIQRFHHSISGGGSPPIPYREIALTARIMDSVFDQIRISPG